MIESEVSKHLGATMMLTMPLTPRWLTRSLLQTYKTRGDDIALTFSQVKKIVLPFSQSKMALVSYALDAAIPGSLPADEAFLKSICAKYVDDDWALNRTALLDGWVPCSDGNLYNPELSLAICCSTKTAMYLNWRALKGTVGRGVELSVTDDDLALAKIRIDELGLQVKFLAEFVKYGRAPATNTNHPGRTKRSSQNASALQTSFEVA